MKKLNYKNVLTPKSLTENKGITLIALIVTIIIVLILASVSVAVFNKTGIIKKSKFAGENYQNKINEEERAMQNYATTMNEYTIADAGRDDTITISKSDFDSLVDRVNKLEKNQNSAFEMEQLVDYVHPTSKTRYILKKSLNNYRYLYFVYGLQSETYNSYIMSVDSFKNEKKHSLFFSIGGGKYTWYYYVDDNNIDILQTGEWSCSLYGIK